MLHLKQGHVLTCLCRVTLSAALHQIQGGLSQDGGGQVVLEAQAHSLR